jgi:hypothetical protein
VDLGLGFYANTWYATFPKERLPPNATAGSDPSRLSEFYTRTSALQPSLARNRQLDLGCLGRSPQNWVGGWGFTRVSRNHRSTLPIGQTLGDLAVERIDLAKEHLL